MAMRKAALISAILVLSGVPGNANEHDIYRALIADHANGKLTLIDPSNGASLAHYGVEGPARLKSMASQRFILASQSAQGRVNVIDSGIRLTSHGDHFDISAKAPQMLPISFAGQRPSHINEGGGMVAVFYDGTGHASLVTEASLTDSKSKSKPIELKTAGPQHGLAAPMGMHVAMSIPHPTEPKELPIGIDVVSRAGVSVARSATCPKLHGEGALQNMRAFGCADGVLLLREARGQFSFEKIAYPTTLPPDRMVRNMSGGRRVTSFLADYGPDGMVVIDPAAKSFTYVGLPSRRIAFARESLSGEAGYVLTEEGILHKINALLGGIDKSLAVTDRYSLDGGSAVARPRISASGDLVAVTDPAKGRVHIIDARTMTLARTIAVPGAPFDVVLVGGAKDDH